MTFQNKQGDLGVQAEITAVPFYRHSLSAEDAASVAAVLATPFLTSGPVGREVEAQLRDYFNAPFAKLTNSWTNGAVATMMAMGIGEGDEVIVPSMTFIASSNVIELVGATPIFVDSDPDTLLIDIDAVKAAVTERTRAIMPVHLYGQMVDMKALRAAVGDNIMLIEDCAHAFESILDCDRPLAHSDAAIFSFYATKNVACGEGGAVLLRDEALGTKLQQTILHGMSAGADRRFEGKTYNHWNMEDLGTKANLPDLLASLLPAQIKTVESRRQQREDLAKRYNGGFAGNADITLVSDVAGCTSAFHLYVIAVPMGLRDRTLFELNQAGVGSTVNYRAVHTMGYYAKKYGFKPEAFPIAYDWGERCLSLPMFPGLSDAEQDYVIKTVNKVVEQATKNEERVAS